MGEYFCNFRRVKLPNIQSSCSCGRTEQKTNAKSLLLMIIDISIRPAWISSEMSPLPPAGHECCSRLKTSCFDSRECNHGEFVVINCQASRQSSLFTASFILLIVQKPQCCTLPPIHVQTQCKRPTYVK